MVATYITKTARDGSVSELPFNKAMQDKDGSGTSVGDVTSIRDSSGNDIDPARDQSVQSLVSALGAPITDATMPAGGVGWYGWLSAIWSKLSGTIAVSGTFWQTTQPVSAASLPLPSGAAQESGGNLASIAANVSTTANQTAANTTLASILTKLGAVVLAAGSAIIGKVGIDQTTPGTTNGVVINAIPGSPVVASTSAVVSQVLKASAGSVASINVAAVSAPGFLLLLDAASAPADGAVAPVWAIPVAGGGGIAETFSTPITVSNGAVLVLSSAASPFTKTTGPTGFLSGQVK